MGKAKTTNIRSEYLSVCRRIRICIYQLSARLKKNNPNEKSFGCIIQYFAVHTGSIGANLTPILMMFQGLTDTDNPADRFAGSHQAGITQGYPGWVFTDQFKQGFLIGKRPVAIPGAIAV